MDNATQNRDERPLSPCILICTLDDEQRCLGCHRSLDQIRRWSGMTVAEAVGGYRRIGPLAKAQMALQSRQIPETDMRILLPIVVIVLAGCSTALLTGGDQYRGSAAHCGRSLCGRVCDGQSAAPPGG